MKLLTTEEQDKLRHKYKNNDLYRQWAPILSKLQSKNAEADVVTLWYVAQRQIVHLRNEESFREQEIAPIFANLVKESLDFNGVSRSEEQARRTATTVMCIMLTMLMNAVEKGHEDEYFDNEPMCLAIFDLFLDNTFFKSLMDLFFKREKGYDGQKVVITPSDPMKADATQSMDDVATERTMQMINAVISHTEGLKAIFDNYWSAWIDLWKDILADEEFCLMIDKKEPNGTDWGMNQKMVMNVVGMFRGKAKINAPIAKLNDAISNKNRRSYISNHADFEGNDSVFNRKQHTIISRMIDKNFSAPRDK